MKPKVLVLMAVYNGSKYLEEQLESILSQRFVDVVVNVFDDASIDNSVEILNKFVDRGASVSVFLNSVGTGSPAKNFFRAVIQCDSDGYDYFAFSDQDDVWEENKLFAAIQALDKSDAQGYSCAVKTFGFGKAVVLAQSNSIRRYDYLFEGAGQGCTFVVRPNLFLAARQVLLEHSNICQNIHYHDWFFYFVSRVKSLKWFFDSSSYLNYRQHQSNDTGSKKSFAGALKRLMLVRSGWYRRQIGDFFNLYLFVGLRDGFFDNFFRLFQKTGFLRNVVFSFYVFRFGRRKIADRLLLTLFCLLGWV